MAGPTFGSGRIFFLAAGWLVLSAGVCPPSKAQEGLARPGSSIAVLNFFNLTGEVRYDEWETLFGRGLRRAVFLRKDVSVVRYGLIHDALQATELNTHYIAPEQIPPIAERLQADLVVLGSFNVVDGVIAASLKVVDGKTGNVLEEETRFGYEEDVDGFLEDLKEGLVKTLFGNRPVPPPTGTEVSPSPAPAEVESVTETVPSDEPVPSEPVESASRQVSAESSTEPEEPGPAPPAPPSPESEPSPPGEVELEVPVGAPVVPDGSEQHPAHVSDNSDSVPARTSPPPVENALNRAWQRVRGSGRGPQPMPSPPREPAAEPTADSFEPIPGAPGTGIREGSISPGSQPQPVSRPPTSSYPSPQNVVVPQQAGGYADPFAPVGTSGTYPQPPPTPIPLPPRLDTGAPPIEVELPPLQKPPRFPPEEVQSPFQPVPVRRPTPPPPQIGYPHVPPQPQAVPSPKPRGVRRFTSWLKRVFTGGSGEGTQGSEPPPGSRGQPQTPPVQNPPRRRPERKKFLWIFDRQESNAAPIQHEGPPGAPAPVSENALWVADSSLPNKARFRTDVPIHSSFSSLEAPDPAFLETGKAGEEPTPPRPRKAFWGRFPSGSFSAEADPSLFELGNRAFEEGNFDLAEDLYRKALVKNPDEPNLMFNLGQVYLALDREEDAVDAFEKTVARNPGDREAWDRLGKLYAAHRRWGKAVDAFTELALMEPGNPDHFVRLGLAFDRVGNPKQAVRAYKKALSIDPENARAARNLASVYLKLGKQEAARPYLVLARRLNPQDDQLDRLEWLASLPAVSTEPTRGTLFAKSAR